MHEAEPPRESAEPGHDDRCAERDGDVEPEVDDAFGLPAENAAIERRIHPYKWTMSNIDVMRRQMRSMGAMWDWPREVVTCDAGYYKWNQWFFLKMYERGLAYRKLSPVDWCPKDNTTLAREGLRDRAFAKEEGGLSGRPLFTRATHMLARVYQLTEGKLSLIGVGGIDSGETALAKIGKGKTIAKKK